MATPLKLATPTGLDGRLTGEVAVAVDGVYRDIGAATDTINDCEPLLIRGYRDVRRRARQETVSDLARTPLPWASVRNMEMASPGELPVYQMFPGPLATQHGALVGYGGVGPVIGKISALLFTIAKLSGLWAGVNPRTSSQNAAPSGVLVRNALGSDTAALDPASAPSPLRGSCRREPEVMVTAAQLLPTAICAAEGSVSATTLPSTLPDGQAMACLAHCADYEQMVRSHVTRIGLRATWD